MLMSPPRSSVAGERILQTIRDYHKKPLTLRAKESKLESNPEN